MPGKINTSLYIYLAFVFSISYSTYAAEILKVSKNKAMILLDGSNYPTGQLLEVLDKNGNQVAILEVTKSGSKYAVANLIRGKIKKGLIVEKVVGFSNSKTIQKQKIKKTETKNAPVKTENRQRVSDNEYKVKSLRGKIGVLTTSEFELTPILMKADYIHLLSDNFAMRYGVVYWDASDSSFQVTSKGLHLGAMYLFDLSYALTLEIGGVLGYESINRKTIANGKLTERSDAGATISPALGLTYWMNDTLSFGFEVESTSYQIEDFNFSANTIGAFLQYSF